ncbi:hypothetical protein J7E98_17355 [Streptomyces sp. ISL-86]|nr:hypothetical protein [Streptomyces sp. ISL-86]
MRHEVAKLLGLADGDPVTRDAQEFGAYARTGGWRFALKVARCVQPGTSQSERSDSSPPRGNSAVTKVSAKEFGRRAGCSADRVMRFYRAWGRAAEKGVVPNFAELQPGVDVELPDGEDWGIYYSTRSSADSERGALITAAAEAQGIRPTKALEIAENPTALRAAILADPATAEAARGALMDRLDSDPALQSTMAKHIADTTVLKKAVAEESKRAEQIEYVRQAVEQGTVKTPAGQILEIPDPVKAEAEQRLVPADETQRAGSVEANAAYEVLHQFVLHSIEADPQAKAQERRTKIYSRIKQASKAFEQLTLDDAGGLYEPELVDELERLQNSIAACIENLKSSAQPPGLRAVRSA